MSRLSEVDLSVRLSKSEGKKQLAAAQERLVHLRLLLGGQIGPGELGPPLCVLFEGWDASGKGGAIKRLVERTRPPARAGGAVRRAHLRREAAPLPLAVLAGAARLGRHGRARPHLVRPGAGRAGRGVRDRGGVAAGLRRDRRPRDHAGRRGHDPGQVLDARLAGGAAAPVRVPPGRPVQGVEAHRRGLAQPGEAAGLRGGGRGDARAHRHRRSRRGTSSPATTSAGRGWTWSARSARRSSRR